jgi:putative transposase
VRVKIKVQAHSVYQTQYHVVWIPKYRRKILVPGVKEYLEKAFSLILAERYPDVYISEQNIQPDHIHILVEIPPKYAVSTVIGALKGGSSRLLRKQFAFLREKHEVWSVGYFVSSVGANEAIVRRYIQFQEKQDFGQATLAPAKKPRAKR